MSASLLQNDQLLAQNAQPKVTPGVVQDSSPSPSGSGSSSFLSSLLMPLMVFAVFIPILWLSSRRQKKETQAREALRKGDRVVSNAGIIGELVSMDERIARVKVSPSVTLEMLANTIAPFEPEKSSSKELKDAKPVSEKK